MKKLFLLLSVLFFALSVNAQQPRINKYGSYQKNTALPLSPRESWFKYDFTNSEYIYYNGLSWVNFYSSLTASNGLTRLVNNFKLGGTLTEETNINLGIHSFLLNDAESPNFLQWNGSGNGQLDIVNSAISINASSPAFIINFGGVVNFTNTITMELTPTALNIGKTGSGVTALRGSGTADLKIQPDGNNTPSVIDQVLTALGVNGEVGWKDPAVKKSGIPVANQLTRWLNSDTLLAIPEITWDGSNFVVGDINGIFTLRNLTGFSEIYASNRFDFETNDGVRINDIGKTNSVTFKAPSGGNFDLSAPNANGKIATEEFVTPTAQTGTVLDLGFNRTMPYNIAAASSSITYTTTNVSIGGAVKCLINAATEPTVTGATKISSPTFQANTDMFMIVYTDDGTNVEYYFLLK